MFLAAINVILQVEGSTVVPQFSEHAIIRIPRFFEPFFGSLRLENIVSIQLNHTILLQLL